MDLVRRFIELSGISEDEALAALVAAVSPPQLGALRQNWKRQPQFGESAPPTKTLRKLFEDADFRCGNPSCNRQVRLTIDHINGDSTDHSVGNLQVLCFSCNRGKNKQKVKNVDHARRLVAAIMQLYDASKVFPTNQEIKAKSGVTRVGRGELIAYLRRRTDQHEKSKRNSQ